MIKVKWGTPAQVYILHDYPNGVAEISEEEIKARVEFAKKQAQRWIAEAYNIAEQQGGEQKFAFGMEQAGVWQRQADILEALLEP